MDLLPPEILTSIWKYLSCKDLLNVLLVSKTFADTCNNDAVWLQGARNSGIDKYNSFGLHIDQVVLESDREFGRMFYEQLDGFEVNYSDLCFNLQRYLGFLRFQQQMLYSSPRESTSVFQSSLSSILQGNEKYFCCLLRYTDMPVDADAKLVVWNTEHAPLFCGFIDFDLSDSNRKVKLREDVVFIVNSGCATVYKLPPAKDLESCGNCSLGSSSLNIPSNIQKVMTLSLGSTHMLSNICICTSSRYSFVCSSLTITILDSLNHSSKDYFLPALIGFPVGISVSEILECISTHTHLILKVKASSTFLFVFILRYEPSVAVDSFVPNLVMSSKLIFDAENFLYVQNSSEMPKEIMVYSGSIYIRNLFTTSSDDLVTTNQGIICIASSTSFSIVTCKGEELKFEFDQLYSWIYSQILTDYIIILENVTLVGLKYGLIMIFSYNPGKGKFQQCRVITLKHQLDLLSCYDGVIRAFGMRGGMFCHTELDYKP